MQRVFKLIIDELKKAARSELKIYGGARSNGKSILLGYRKGLEDAVFIVNQTVKEYNNGWILCSERLPEEEEAYTYNGEEDTYEPNELIIMIEGATLPTVAFFDGEDFTSVYNNEFLNKVIAWQPLPEPYKEGESQCKE